MESTKSQITGVPRLVVIEGKDKGKVIALKDGTLVVGRSKGDILVHDPRVSRSHVALHFNANSQKLSFTDLKSLNGTMVNGSPIEAGDLNDGDKLQIGNTVFDCQIADAIASTASPREEVKKSRSKFEDELVPLEADSAEEEENEEERAPSRSQQRKKSRPLAIAPLMRKLGSGKTRIAMGLVLGFVAFLILGQLTGGSPESLDREITSIRLLESQGKIEEAISKAESLNKQYTANSRALATLGDLYAIQQRNEAAIEMYRKSHELQPDTQVIHVKLARLLLRTSLKAEAQQEMKHIDDIVKNEKKSKEFFIETAQLYLDFRELTESNEKAFILARALQTEVAPNSTIGYRLETQALLQQNRAQDAIDTIEKGLKVDTTDDWLLENRTFTRLNLKDLPNALKSAEEWIHFHPTNTKGLLVAAYLKVNEKNYLQALPDVQRVIQLLSKKTDEPHYAEALHLAGQIYWAQNQRNEAESHLKQACDLGFQQACLHELIRGPSSVPPGPVAPPTKP